MRIDALGILLALAAVAFAAVEPRRPRECLALLAGFAAAALAFGPQRFPGPDAVGVLIAGAAAENDIDLLARVAAKGHFIAVGEGLLPKEHYVGAGAIWDERARAFWEHSGERNQLGLLEYALQTAGVDGVSVPEPTASLEAAYYYPASDGVAGAGQVFASWDAFDRWRDRRGKRRRRGSRACRIPTRPTTSAESE